VETFPIFGNFPNFIGTFLILWEFSEFYGNLKKVIPLDKGIVFSNKWELSHFYRNLKKAFLLDKGYVFSNKWVLSHFYRNFLVFMGI